MAEKRNRNPSDVECFILDVFLNRIYRDRDGANRYDLWSIRDKDGNPICRMPYLWSNTPKDLYEQYCRACPEDKGFKKYDSDSIFRKTLDTLEKKGILKQTQNIDRVLKESKYYPVETTEGYLNLIRHVANDYANGFYPNKKFGLDPLYSKYSEIVLNRQFVLDCLRRKAGCFRLILDGEIKEVPILGRYLKNYEIGPRMKNYIDLIEETKKLIEDQTVTDYKPIMNLLLDCDDPLPENDNQWPDYYTLTPEKRISNLKMLNKLLVGLQSELIFIQNYEKLANSPDDELVSMKQFSDSMNYQYARHLSEIAPDYTSVFDNSTEIYGLSWYKQEATWNDPLLTDEEMKQLMKIHKEFSEHYAEWLNGSIIMPLLCLAQMSPTALFFIACDAIKPAGGYFTSSTENKPLTGRLGIDPSEDPELTKYKTSLKSFNIFLGYVTKYAMADYLSGKVRVQKRSIHDKLTLTQLMSFGYSLVKLTDEKNLFPIPALFTFEIYKDCVTYIMYNDVLNYKVQNEILSPVANLPDSRLFDWSPAMAQTVHKDHDPLTRLYEITNLVASKEEIGDSYLSYLIRQSVLRGLV